MPTILLIFEDKATKHTVGDFLAKEGHKLLDARSLEDAIDLLYNGVQVDLVLMDILLLSNHRICEEIRAIDDIPVMVTGRPEQMVKGFALGADDYIATPVNLMEFMMRTRAILRRYKKSMSDTLTLSNMVLKRTSQEVQIEDKQLVLPLKEFEILFKLASYPKQPFSRNQLIEQIWGTEFDGNYRTVDVHIKRLRYRFEPITDIFRIVTIWGVGYKLEMKAELEEKTKEKLYLGKEELTL
ncbi:response regulator transcription factor [Paenibacillus puerhi]|uniref:response regulator transcription factor n=1 Tax=Paenibacillus puerhi TaxID=2692622 RepID=UPI00135CD41D|nr:response regulator transcription factor [Paenibacillus puerhi]